MLYAHHNITIVSHPWHTYETVCYWHNPTVHHSPFRDLERAVGREKDNRFRRVLVKMGDVLVKSQQRNFLIVILLLQKGQFLKNNKDNPLELMISGELAYISTHLHNEQLYKHLHKICYRVSRLHPVELVNHHTFNE